MIHQKRNVFGLLLVVLCGLVVVVFSKQSATPAVDTNAYQEVMSAQVADVYDLEQYFVDRQYTFLPIVPPDPNFTLVQSDGQVLPFNWKAFPAEFKNLVPKYENSVPVYPLTIFEDPATREVVFLNADGDEIYSIPPATDYNPYAYAESLSLSALRSLYDPARIRIETRLIPQEYVEDYLYVKDRITAALSAEASLLSEEGIGGMMLLRSGDADSNIVFEAMARTNTGLRMRIGYPDGFTNRLDVFTCNDLMQYVWVFATKGLSTSGTNEIAWVDTNYWVSIGPSVRFYSAGNADLDTDHDGYSDASEIMVYRTDHTASNSRPIRISGTASYSGIETGTIRVLSTTVSSSWSIAQSVALPGPGAYSNDIGNNQSYWFKAFRDVNGSFVRDVWEPCGVYSVNSTLITNDTTGLNITIQDQPSLWGAVSYSGTETGNVYVVAVTASNSWNTAYSSMLSWNQGSDPMTGGTTHLTFPASFSIAGMPVSNYWLKAFIDTNYDGAYTEGEVAGQYTANAIPVSNRLTGLNFTLNHDTDGDGLPDWWEWQHGTAANNPDTDGDGVNDGDEVNIYGTDPLNKYSAPPLPMLQAQGQFITDTNGNKVVLKAVNIGGWLAWEQWMMKYEPNAYTNNMGYLSYGNMDENRAREAMADRLDGSLTLYASQGSSSNNLTGGTSWADPTYCPWDTKYAGSFDSGDWICFSNKNFGTGGLTNLALAIAVPSNYAGRQIQVRLGSASGAILGTLTTRPTGTAQDMNWCAFDEQFITVPNLTGSQTVFFVGAGGGGGIANLFRFRFYGDSTNTRSLFNAIQDNYFTTNDLDKIKALGYNCIRLPFFHYLLEDDHQPYQYKASGWSRLDWVVGECAKRRIWCILDMHGAPGGVNPWHSCGVSEPFRNRLWGSEYNKDRTEKMWVAISTRYATNTAVVGYDLINEPYPPMTNGAAKDCLRKAFSNDIVPMLTRLHRAVRSNDTAHILFMEGNMMWTNMWEDVFWWPSPASKGWTNVVYEFHHYDKVGTWQDPTDHRFSAQKEIADRIVKTYTRLSQEKNVPVFIGEFCPIKMQNFDYFIRQFDANGIHWAHWNYRHWGWDDPTYSWSSWGLNYRNGGIRGGVNTNIQPNLLTDSLAVLSNKLSQYNSTNYSDHLYFQRVIRNDALPTNVPKERTEFYLNTFNGPYAYSLTDTNAWPWRKIVGVGNPAKFWIQNSRAQLKLDAGPLLLRFKSREEADARFEVNDSTGCWFGTDIMRFDVLSTVAGREAEVRLAVVRDQIEKTAYTDNVAGVIARLSYDQSVGSSNASVVLYAKTGGTNAYGSVLCSNTISFATGATLKVYVNSTNALFSYNGVTNSGAHGLSLSNWIGGAVCAVEVEDPARTNTAYVELDNFRAWRPSAGPMTEHINSLTNYPAGIHTLAESENLSIRTWDYTNDWNNSYMTNNMLFCIPEKKANGWQCVNPRKDYHNDVRLSFTPTNVVEVRTAYSTFSQGIAKICAMPEYFPGAIFDEYQGSTLYVETSRSGGNLVMTAYRHTGAGLGGRTTLATCTNSYVDSRGVSMQFSTNTVHVYYGTNLVINALHGLTNVPAMFTEGVYPHYEFQNTEFTTTATVRMGALRCRRMNNFTVPSE